MKSEVEILKGKIEKVLDVLGKFKYYTEPTEEQNEENSDIVRKSYDMLDRLVEGDEEDE